MSKAINIASLVQTLASYGVPSAQIAQVRELEQSAVSSQNLCRDLLVALKGCTENMEWNTDSAKHACNIAGEMIARAEDALNHVEAEKR
jgi:hypothetical protein